MFILTRSTKRDVASTSYTFPSPHPSDTMKFTCWQCMRSTLPASWRNFGDSSWLTHFCLDVSSLSNLTFAFSSWMFSMRRFVLIVLPLKQFSSRIRIGTPFLLWSMSALLNPQSIIGRLLCRNKFRQSLRTFVSISSFSWRIKNLHIYHRVFCISNIFIYLKILNMCMSYIKRRFTYYF